MSYAPTTDFLALLRRTESGIALSRMPGLDFVAAAMARAGLFRLWVGQSAPLTNQASTVWLRPATPSWTAEGVVFLYDSNTKNFAPATPALWTSLLLSTQSSYVFQSVGLAAAVIDNSTTLIAVRRDAPSRTDLMLPAIVDRSGQPLRIVDWSLAVTEHAVVLATPDGALIMRRANWTIYSTADQLGGVTLYPSPDLNGWVIAP